MTFDGFDAVVLIESTSFVPITEGVAAGDGNTTLDATLARAGLSGQSANSGRQTLFDRNEDALPDLWINSSPQSLARLAIRNIDEPAILRDLSEDEVMLMSGGRITAFWEQHIEVEGVRYFEPDWGWLFDFTYTYSDVPVGGGGSPLMNPEHQQTEDANSTPCVDQVPAGVDLDQLNDLAKHMANQVGQLQTSTGWEWAALIYMGPDGQLYQSDPFTAQHPHDLDGASTTIPTGSHVVGYVHSHPIDPNVDERTLSLDDQDFIRDFIAADHGSFTVDSNLIAYISTRDSSSDQYFDNYRYYVYDKSNRNSSNPGCEL